ncbi:MAG TPA: nickel pincer cofactor biosynthesis protein LarC [Terriglobales bacterium]|nr:nickel pincer cofactor biosynthesis protein LarC [Terriglobales bacterium]
MRIAYLDCFSGISGDMFLGALLDAGVPVELLERTVAALNIGARLEVHRVLRGGISATKVDVCVHGQKDLPRDEFLRAHEHSHDSHSARPDWRERENQRRHEHLHEHHHDHFPLHHHHNAAQQGAAPVEHARQHHDHAHGRNLGEIKQIIAAAPISQSARKTSIAIFEALGAAEARIHNAAIDTLHFHEVGAADALVDIVCAAVGSEALNVDEWVCSPLNVGGGTVKCAHGVFPVPAPATVELLRDAPVYSSGVNLELVTPTGAAIVKVLASRFGAFPAMQNPRAAYGAGTRDIAGQANVVRLTIGESAEASHVVQQKAEGAEQDVVTVLEATLDDLSPQVFAYVMERALAEGALDAFATPVQMKKNRPGTLLTVLCRPTDAARITKLLFAESTTLGVRMRDERRQVLARRSVSVTTPWGDVRMKVANLNGAIANAAPEYEDCRRVAAEHRVPLKQVMQEAMRAYLNANPDARATESDSTAHPHG